MTRILPKIYQTALILKPLPDGAASGEEPVRFGGRPKLPVDIEWPRRDEKPLHFLAQIDLAAMPRQVVVDENAFPLPKFPQEGTLFFFMAMDDAGINEKRLPHVIHIEDQIADVPERQPPHDFIPLHQKGHIIEEDGWMDEPEGSFVDQRRVLESGEGIMPQNVSVIPYLSTQAENPLARNMERLSAPDEVTISDWADQLQTASLEAALAPKPGERRPFDPPIGHLEMWRALGVSKTLLEIDRLRDFDLDWEFVLHFSRKFCCEVMGDLRSKLQTSIKPKDLEYVPSILQSIRDCLNVVYDEAPQPRWLKIWKKLYNHIPDLDSPIDTQLERWIELAREPARPMSRRQKKTFVGLWHLIEEKSKEDLSVELSVLEGCDLVGYKWSELYDILVRNIRICETPSVPKCPAYYPETWNDQVIYETAMPLASEAKFRAFGANRVPIQMFGAGYLLQNAAIKHAEDILLLQIGDRFGCPLNFVDVSAIYQLWISSQDLAVGRFDRLALTIETT